MVDQLGGAMDGIENSRTGCGVIEASHLGPRRPGPPKDTSPTRTRLIDVLIRTKGNVSRTADHSALQRKQLCRWFKDWKIDPQDYRKKS